MLISRCTHFCNEIQLKFKFMSSNPFLCRRFLTAKTENSKTEMTVSSKERERKRERGRERGRGREEERERRRGREEERGREREEEREEERES